MPILSKLVPQYRSLHTKLTMILLLTVMVPVVITAAYSYHKATAAYEDSAVMIDQEHLILATSSIDGVLKQIPGDLAFLKGFHDLKRYLLWHDIGEDQEAARWLKSTVNGFKSFMQTNEIYMQLRVIDAEGWEVIRINRDENATVTVSRTADLQRKHDSDYFKETMQLSDGQMYVSKLNLNREYGRIQKPHTPVIRYALPIIDQNGTRHGMVVLNLFAATFLDGVANLVDADEQEGDSFYVINQSGFYLGHTNKNKTFGFELAHRTKMSTEKPELWQALQGEGRMLLTETSAYSFDKVYPLGQNEDRYWYVVHAVPREVLLKELSGYNQVFFSMLLLLLILVIFLTRPLIHMLVRPIKQVTENLQRLERGETRMQVVHYNGHDELRSMVDAAQGMSARIGDAIAQANKIAQGNFRTAIQPLSDQDELGIALRDMTKTLEKVSNIVASVAKGDLSQSIKVRSEYDQLGLSINEMISAMSATVKQADAIAQGDFRADILPRSNKDQLGSALKNMTENLRNMAATMTSLTTGHFEKHIHIRGEYDQLGQSIAKLNDVLRDNAQDNEEKSWLKTNLTDMGQKMQKQDTVQALVKQIMLDLPPVVHASHAAFFVLDDEDKLLKLAASYAYNQRKSLSNHFALGEGLVGQCALENRAISLSDPPDDYVRIQSGLGDATPHEILVLPLSDDRGLVGVLELAALRNFTVLENEFLMQVITSIGIALRFVTNSSKTKHLLAESERMTTELQARQDDLHAANSMLEERANALEKSERLLHAQQATLQQNNDELVEKNTLVEEQKATLETASHDLEIKAKELSDASKYKSEFLANMSHELRTPMNSIIGFTGRVIKKAGSILPERQLKNLYTVERNANHLLALINSLLDISKIEAGKMELYPEAFSLHELGHDVIDLTHTLAESKSLDIHLKMDESIEIFNDKTKLKQVLINLISNAVKFTDQGHITLAAKLLNETETDKDAFSTYGSFVEISVVDTGIGMSQESVDYVFEAFRQVDGSNTRSYGGTGLGLNISSRFCRMMGGDISVSSEESKGSSFVVRIPLTYANHVDITDNDQLAEPSSQILKQLQATDPSQQRQTILCIDDNPDVLVLFHEYLMDAGFHCEVAQGGEEGLQKARELLPMAIVLDVQMPYMDGWTVLKALKSDPLTVNIPVLMATMMDNKGLAYELGAFSYLEKPVSPASLIECIQSIPHRVQHVLVVDDEEAICDLMQQMLADHGMQVSVANDGVQAIEFLEKMGDEWPDLIILDLMMPNMNGFEVLDQLASVKEWSAIPVVVSTAKILSAEEELLLASRSTAVLQKGGANLERILSEILTVNDPSKLGGSA